MRPVFVAWLVRHGWPAWFCPDYAAMAGFSTIVSAILLLRLAQRDGAKVHIQARAILCTYVGALLGGYLFEWIRMIPVAVAERSIEPIAFAGRAAYGALIFGTLASVPYLWRRGERVLAYCDRATIGLGICFACVRFGCFLEGCDFGRPTASWVGVRFPGGSLASQAHAAMGWIPPGAESLPVHPTELYECGVGLLATLLALVPLRRGRRDGAAFATWLVTYAIGRFLLELLRGDVERGHYASLSTAQWVSIGILTAVTIAVARRRAQRSVVAAVAGVAVVLSSTSEAHAQSQPGPGPGWQVTPSPSQPGPGWQVTPTAPPPAAPSPTAAPAPAPPAPATPKESEAENEAAKRVATIRASLVSSWTIARPDTASGWAAELDLMYRLRVGRRVRFDLGVEGRRYENVDAIHVSAGLIGELVIEAARHFELLFTLVPHHTWFDFKSEFWPDTNAYGLRYGMGAQFPIGHVVLGVTPLAFNTTSQTTIGVIAQWEPRFWFGVSF